MSNSKDIVTRCPQCNTAFRVTLNQLAVADGQVRCGSCLAVFRAVDHNAREEKKSPVPPKSSPSQTQQKQKASVKQSSPTPNLDKPAPKASVKQATKATAKQNTPTQTTAPAAQKIAPKHKPRKKPAKPQHAPQTKVQTSSKESHTPVPERQSIPKVEASQLKTAITSDSDDLLIADEESGKLDLDADIFDLKSENKSKKTSLFDRKLTTTKEQKSESADESWAIKMLAELEEEEHQEEEKKTQFIIKPESLQDTNELLDDEDYEPKIEPVFNIDDNLDPYDEPETEEIHQTVSSGYDQIDLGIDLETNDPAKQVSNTDSPLYFENTTDSKTKSNIEYNLDSALEDIGEAKADKLQEQPEISDEDIENAMHSSTRYQDDSSNYLANIEPEPVEMVGLSSPNTQRWLWRIGVVLLGLLLALQVAIIRFDTLSKHPSYRAYYGSACNMFGCTLPSLIDTQQIRTTNLIVRSHPKRTNALVIDAILINNAKFTQPFPALQLEFSDINDQLVAKRQLQPDEYLRGELAGARQMTNNQPIQLSIEIVDPGDTAVNYQLTVVQARQK